MKNFLKNLPIRSQLLLSFLSLTILPLILTSALCFLVAAGIIGRKAEQYTRENVSQLSDNIDNYLSQIELTSLAIAYNPNVQNFLTEVNEGRPCSRAQLYQLEKSMILTYNYSTMRDISVISRQGEMVSVPHPITGQYGYLDSLQLQPHTAMWFNDPSQHLLQMVRYVESSKNYQPIGTLCISMYSGFINELSNNLGFGADGFLTVLDSSSVPVMMTADKNEYLAGREDRFIGDSGDFTDKIHNKTYHYFYRVSPKTGWKTIGVISLNELFSQIIYLGAILTVCLVFVCVIALLVSRRLASFFSRKIQEVLGAMKLVSNGDFSVQLPVGEATNEFTELNLGFNSMVAEINTLIDTVYKVQILQKESEFKALQAEINPHFLYNTLDTICWQAKLGHNEEIFQTTFSLAALLRASVGNKKLFVTLEEELSYVGDYILIQKARYRDRITAEIEVPQELYRYQIPKLVLQPIVENAYVHGLEMKRGQGLLTITGAISNHVITIRVCDNGIGMTQEQIDGIFCQEDSPSRSIGLGNVHRRLKLLYGSCYGIQIRSVFGEGTTVTLTLPTETNQEHGGNAECTEY